MSLARKLRTATLYFSVRHTGADQLVLEYWLYYLNNPYRIRGGLVPFRIDGSHAHDLERLVLALGPSPGSQTHEGSAAPQYAIRTVLASAHSVAVPINRYDFSPGQSASQRLRFLVELGSHAMAPDINGDNVFTPAIDATGSRKFVWGIRDRGDTWARYDASYADAREPSSSVCLSSESHGGEGAADDRCFRYRLAPAEEFLELAAVPLSAEEQHVAFERSGWFKRTFGDGGPAGLMSPSRPDREAPAARLIDRVAADERAFAVGFSNVRSAGALLAGARYAWLNESAYVPDLLAGSDLFVLSSAWEGSPNALLEAMAGGLPVVSTPAGGAGEILAGSGAGVLTADHEPDSLAAAMRELEDASAADLSRMGQAGRRFVEERHGPAAVADAWESLFRRLIADRSRP